MAAMLIFFINHRVERTLAWPATAPSASVSAHARSFAWKKQVRLVFPTLSPMLSHLWA